jgi:hypothetical protein
MRAPTLPHLHLSLKTSPEFKEVHDAWTEQERLRQALGTVVPGQLMNQICRVRRSDPGQGIRGSELTITATTAAAAVKLRLLLADQEAGLAALGLGFQSFRVLAQRRQSVDSPKRPPPERAAIPAKTKQDFRQLAAGLAPGPLKSALLKIGRSPKGS